MHKKKAIELLGGTIVLAADAIGISYQAVDKWPDELPDRISDRVLAVLARKHLPANLLGDGGMPIIQTNAPAVIAGELPVSRVELVEAINAKLIVDPRQTTRREADRVKAAADRRG